jgi:hypothetical protein
VIKIDSNGNKLWEKTYDLGSRGVIFTDASLLGKDGDFALVGFSGQVGNISGVLPFDIFVFRCNAQGEVVTQQNFPGWFYPGVEPQICQLDPDTIIVTYDKNPELKVTDQRIRALDSDLKLLWEKQVVQTETRRPIGFKVGVLDGSNFIVADDTLGDLCVYLYDISGNRLNYMCLDKFIFAGRFSLTTTEGKTFVISQTSPDKESGISKVKVVALELSP